MSRRVRCEVTAIDPEVKCWQGYSEGDIFFVDIKRCPPICPKLFHAIFPSAYVYMNTNAGTGPRSMTVTCPDRVVSVKLTRDVEERTKQAGES